MRVPLCSHGPTDLYIELSHMFAVVFIQELKYSAGNLIKGKTWCGTRGLCTGSPIKSGDFRHYIMILILTLTGAL